MKKFLSSLLALALTFGCCEPCLVYGAAVDLESTTVAQSAQEKEIKKLKQKLKEHALKQFKEIDKIKHMSNPRYFLYKLGKYLGTFLLVALGVGVSVFLASSISEVVFILRPEKRNDKYYKQGHSDGFLEGKHIGFENGRNEGYDLGNKNGYVEGYNDGQIAGFEIGNKLGFNCGKLDGLNEGTQKIFDKYFHWFDKYTFVLADVKKFFNSAKLVISCDAFERYNIFYKNDTKVENFCKDSGVEQLWILANDIQNKIDSVNY